MGRSPWWLPWAVYVVLGGAGVGLAWGHRGAVWSAPAGPRFVQSPLVAQALGLAAALVVVLLTVRSTRLLVARTRWARTLHVYLRGVLLGTSAARLLGLACASAVAEELLFRAALLPMCGLVASSLTFGLLHVSSRETRLGWMFWAALMGLVFGVLYVGSGSLLPPILAHAAINYENMQYICSYDPTPLDTRGPGLQSVGSRRV
jgi:uncharacterized protein